MTRYIDADALKESIDEHVYLVHHGFNETEYGCTQYGIHQIIDDAPTIEAVPQWIPCSERLPKEREWIGTKEFGTTISDEVYVTFEGPTGERFCKHLSFQNGKLSPHTQREIDVWYKGSIPIAWMPLPEPYEGKE